jgi:hypothetical protein
MEFDGDIGIAFDPKPKRPGFPATPNSPFRVNAMRPQDGLHLFGRHPLLNPVEVSLGGNAETRPPLEQVRDQQPAQEPQQAEDDRLRQ